MIDAQAQMIGAANMMDLKPALLPIDKAGMFAFTRHEPLEAVAAATRANALTFFWPSEAVP